MPVEQGEGGGIVPDVEGADYFVDAGGCDDAFAVFVPVVCERFRGGEACISVSSHGIYSLWPDFEGGVDGYRGD